MISVADGEDGSFRRDPDRSHPVLGDPDDGDAQGPSRRRGLDLDSVAEELGLRSNDDGTMSNGSWIVWR